MSDNSTITLSNEAGNEIKIDLSVLETILGLAAGEVDGVAGMRGNLRSNLNDWLGRDNHGKGVELQVDDQQTLTGNVYAYFNYGVNVPQVAAKLQTKMRDQLKQMTDLKLTKINVHVVGLVDQAAKAETTGKQGEDAEWINMKFVKLPCKASS